MSKTNLLINGDFEETGDNRWDWLITAPNTISQYFSAGYAYSGHRSLYLEKTVSGDCKVWQIVDMERNIAGELYQLGGWIRVYSLDIGGSVKLYYQWLDINNSQIGEDQEIATITTAGSYTLYSVTDAEAPVTARKINFVIELAGAAVSVIALLDACYIYGEHDYGLKVYDTAGGNCLILSEISSIISSGTISMPNSLNDDGTYGVDISLPINPIDVKNIGVICQVRDFAWAAQVNVLSYDSGNKFWGNFFADDAVTYYEKDEAGIMTTWTAGNMTPGTQSTYNPLMDFTVMAGWDKFGTTVDKVRLFAASFYTYAKTVAGSPTAVTLYAKDWGIETNEVIAYVLSTGQGNTEQTNTIQTPAGWTIHQTTTTYFDVYIVHADGSKTTLGTHVAEDIWAITWGGYGWAAEQRTANWDCLGFATMVGTDAIELVLHIDVYCLTWLPLSTGTYSLTIPFITPALYWVDLDASTWTMPRFISIEQGWYNEGYIVVRAHWGIPEREVKITNVVGTPVSTGSQNVFSIGSNGVSEIDYVVYLKNFTNSSSSSSSSSRSSSSLSSSSSSSSSS